MASTDELVNILLVEDDSVDVEIFTRALKKNRIVNPFCHAIDGIEALEILRNQHPEKKLGHPYLILMDINMPRMNGIECIQEIRSDPDLYQSVIFILTTSADEQDIFDAYNLNIAGYMVKEQLGVNFIQGIKMIDQYCHAIILPNPNDNEVNE